MKSANRLKLYDYLIVGGGLYGATFVYKAKQQESVFLTAKEYCFQ
jgi:UDP-galactopyranose mutase